MGQENVVNGMDMEKLETFRASLKENPITLGLEAKGTWEGHSGRSTVHIGPYRLGTDKIDRPTRHYTVSYGAWREVEDALKGDLNDEQLKTIKRLISYSPVHGLLEYANTVESRVERA
jgi:hypothetical protein